MDNTQEINYSIIIKNNPDKPTLQLLNTYWFFEKGIFPNKPKQLSTENKLRIHDIYVVIKEYSYVELDRAVKVSHLWRIKVSIANQLLKIDSIEV